MTTELELDPIAPYDMPPRETIRIDLFANEVYQSAAAILAVLAYPVDLEKRTRFESVICHRAVADRSQNDSRWRDWHQACGPPLPLIHDKRTLVSAFETGFKTINQRRMLAALQAAPMLRFLDILAGLGCEVPLPLPTSEAMIGQISAARRAIRKSPVEPDRGNLIRDIWIESRPVLHLALAIRDVLWGEYPVGYNELKLSDLIVDKGFFVTILNTADRMRRFAVNAFGIESSEMIRIDWQ